MKDGAQKRCEQENEGWKERSTSRSIREILNPKAWGRGRGPFHHCQRSPYIHGGEGGVLLGYNRPKGRNVWRCAVCTAHIDYSAIALHSALMTEEWNIYMSVHIR